MLKSSDIKVNYRAQYYLFQIFGWGFIVFLIGVFNANNTSNIGVLILYLVLLFTCNFLLSHGYRLLILKYNWIVKPIEKLLLYILISTLILGFFFSLLINMLGYIVSQDVFFYFKLEHFVFGCLIYFIWSILYFVYILFYKARKEEYKNMEMLALNTSVELKNLRSQLNPHFMFNAMNSIRALVDDNPEQSKKAITQLSNVLRNALIHTKKELITLKEELAIVEDYLSLEKIRYEERLQIEKSIDRECLSIKVPPLLLQTIAENAIKHGISKLINGGVIRFEIQIIDDYLSLIVTNTGKLDTSQKPETGIGLQNTIRRLKLIYGNDAIFDIRQIEDTVKTELLILIKNKDENDNN